MTHARTHKRGGQYLIEQQLVQLKLNGMHMLTEALRSFVMRVAWEHDHKVHSANAGLCDELLDRRHPARDRAQHGDPRRRGLHDEPRVDKLVRDAMIWTHLAGDTVQRMKVARRLAR